uniref:Uncharacterized protein n=1 Tax=Arundo donax TaxID=35708 RepID=A0A0A8YTZ2_ARUDO
MVARSRAPQPPNQAAPIGNSEQKTTESVAPDEADLKLDVQNPILTPQFDALAAFQTRTESSSPLINSTQPADETAARRRNRNCRARIRRQSSALARLARRIRGINTH